MAIQQVVPVSLTLVGDGTSTTFKYVISQTFALNFSTAATRVMTSTNTPNGVSATSNLGHVTASLDPSSPKKLVLTFSTAPVNGVQGEVNINLFYNSQ